MILPQANLKAKDLDRNMLPHREVLKAYEKAGKLQDYDRSGHDRVWEWFYSQINGNDKTKNQEIEQRISQMIRLKDSKGEWLLYHLDLFGRNWKGNRVDFTMGWVGRIEGIPIFHNEIDPQTDQIVPGTTQVEEMTTIYTIPFTKEKINEVSQYFTETPGFIIQDRGAGGRRYSCSRDEFINLEYNELISLKTGFTEYMRTKVQPQLKQGGVR